MFGRRAQAMRIYHGADEAFLTDAALGADDYARAARDLAVKPVWPQTIAHIESLGRPFAPSGRPLIRIEKHWWKREAYAGRPDADRARAAKEIDRIRQLNPDSQADRWENFEVLHSIDPVAAVRCTSFGAFQIMGFNHARCGFSDPLLFLEGMALGAGAQTLAFVNFVRDSPKLHAAMKAGDPPAIALHYNGELYAQNRYDVKLRQVSARLIKAQGAIDVA